MTNSLQPSHRLHRTSSSSGKISTNKCVQTVVSGLLVAYLTSAAAATPQKAASFYEDALRRFERQDTSGAVIQLKNALQQDRRMLPAHLLLGKALLKQGDVKGAEAAFEEALNQGVDRSEVVLPLGQIYIAIGRPEFVIDRIPATGLPPAMQVEVLSMRGTAYIELGKMRLATQSFEDARALDPKSVTPLIAEIPMLLSLDQPDQAKAVAAKAIELAPNSGAAWNMHASVLHAGLDLAGAIAAYDRALSLQADHVDARVARAGLLIDLRRYTDADKDLDFLRKSAPSEPRAAYLRAVMASYKGDEAAIGAALRDVVKLIDALPLAWLSSREQLLMVGALSHHGLGNWEKAREYLNVIIARNGQSVAAKKLLASIYVETKDYARALSQLEPMYKAMPEDPQVLFLLGSVHLAQRRYVTATEMLEKAASRTGSSSMNRTLAFSQLELGRGELGLRTLEKVFAANPGDVQAGTTLSMLYMRRGEARKALEVATAMVKREPGNPTALNFLGVTKASTGDAAGARSAYADILAKQPGFRPAVLNLARLDVSEGRIDEARRRLTEVLSKQHDAADVLLELGMLEQRAGRPAEAIRHLEKANLVQRRDVRPGLALIDVLMRQRQFDQALATAKELSSRHPEELAVQLALGRSYLALGDQGNARSIFKSATRWAGSDPRLQVKIARLQLQADNPDGALYNAQRALQGRPDDPAALALVVEIETFRGDVAKADAALKILSEKHPNRVETAVATANVAMARAQFQAAVAAFRTALSRQENTGNAINLVRAHVAAGEAGKAVAFLQTWLKSRPNDVPALKMLAETQFRAGQLPVARETYQRALAAEPDDALMLNNYANLLQKLNDPSAQVYAEKALKLAPHNSALFDTLGWILVQQGQIEPGLRYLREARVRSPENGEIRFHLAFALAKAAREAEARDEFRAAVNGPARVENTEAVTRLKRELGL